MSQKNPIFIYSSTNKVYGGMDDVEIIEEGTRWRYKDLVKGCPETQPLDFHSPYESVRGLAINTHAITPVFIVSVSVVFVKVVFTARANSVWRIRAGWHG
jgi:hypothetical protein